MNIRKYSLRKDGDKNVTPNIKVRELRCKDGTDTIKEDLVIVCFAQFLRDTYNKPIVINSAYRTKSWNKKVGGTSASRHLKSCALDVHIKDIKPQDYANMVYSMGLVRVGVYETFIHMDTDRKPIWLSQGHFEKIFVPYPEKTISINRNKDDYLVAILQYKLNILGYGCGTEDGIAGRKFDKAVRKFQKNNGLYQDGIVGKNTWNRLFN